MLRRAAERLGIDLASSFVIGDRCVDVEAGLSAGAAPSRLNGYGAAERDELLTV